MTSLSLEYKTKNWRNREVPISSRRKRKVVLEAEESDGCAIINEALGAVSDMFEKYTGTFNVTIRFEVNQKTALLGTTGLVLFCLFRDSKVRTSLES